MEGERKRRVNWNKEDEVVLVEEVNRRSSILFARHDGSQRPSQLKSRTWQEIADIINSKGTGGPRDVQEVKKKYQNIKQKAKAKHGDLLRPTTGGGPKPPSPTVPEQLVLDSLEGRPSLCGVVGGIDTEVQMETEMPPTCEAVPETFDLISLLSAPPALLPALSSASTPTVQPPTQPTQPTYSLPVSNKSIESSILSEELQKIKEMRILVKEQTRLARLKQKLAILKIKQLDPSFNDADI